MRRTRMVPGCALEHMAAIILDAITDPASEIAIGVDASRIASSTGAIIDGIVIQSGDPVIIKSSGGQVPAVPRSAIASLTRLKRSLLFLAEMMGLTPQAVAGIIAY